MSFLIWTLLVDLMNIEDAARTLIKIMLAICDTVVGTIKTERCLEIN